MYGLLGRNQTTWSRLGKLWLPLSRNDAIYIHSVRLVVTTVTLSS